MSMILTSGDLGDQTRLANRLAVSDDWTSAVRRIDKIAGITLQLISEFQVDDVVLEEGDGADQSDDELTLAGYDFTGLEGATIRITGSDDNDGDHIITTGADGSAVCSGSTFVDEEFDIEVVTVEVLRTDSPLVGEWAIEVSNDFTNGIGSDEEEDTRRWSDLTTDFSPAIDGVEGDTATEGTDEQTNQPVQADPIDFRAFRIRFDYTSGLGNISVLYFGKGR